MVDPARRAPSPQTLAWVLAQLGPGTRVVRVRRLLGGISSSVHAVATVSGTGTARVVVLRRWVGDWIEDGADLAGLVENERLALDGAERAGVPAPRFVAADGSGSSAGVPALLMTRVPGRIDLTPRDVDGWLRAQAELLPRVHAIDAAVGRSPAPELCGWQPPERVGRPEIWRAMQDALRTRPPAVEATFRHGDYQHFNILWSRGRLIGVVDWTFPSIGSPDLDVGHCQLNLAVLFSAERAERFRAIYETAAGRTVDPWWNLAALANYGDDWPNFIPVQVNGLVAVDGAGMTARVEELVAATLRRLG